MKPTYNFDVQTLLGYTLFYTVLILFLLGDILILPIFADMPVNVLLTLPAIYYWSIYRPSLVPPWILFLLGLCRDLLTSFPFTGLGPFLLILVSILTKTQRTFLAGQSFLMIWAGYVFVCLASMLVFWLAYCLYTWSWTKGMSFALEALFMIFAFPILMPVLGLVHKTLPFAGYKKKPLE